MAQVIDFVSFKCLNQLVNGDDFASATGDTTEALVGNVGEKVKLEYKFRAYWEAHSSIGDTWDIVNTVGSTYTIATKTTNFKDKGFGVGDRILLDDDYTAQTLPTSAGFDASGTITAISPNGQLLTFTLDSGTVNVGTDNSNQQVVAWLGDSALDGLNEWEYMEVGFGLIELAETFNTASKVSGNDQIFQSSNLNYAGSTTMQAKGVFADWKSGNMSVSYATVDGVGEFTIEHELIITPTLPVGNEIGVDPAPDFLASNETLKYAFEIKVRNSRTSSRSLEFLYNPEEGYVGWYQENFNGFGNDYSASTTFSDNASGDPVNALQAIFPTDFEITLSITGTAFSAGDPVAIYLQKQPTETAQIENTTTDFEANHQYHNLVLVEGAAAVSEGVFSNVEANIVGSDMVITGTIELSSAEKQAVSEGDNYLLGVTHHPAAVSAGNSPRVMSIASYDEYILKSTIEGLATITKFNYLKHYESQGVETGSATDTVWNEDGILVDFALKLDKSRNAAFRSMDIILAADNGTDYWEIDKYELELAEAPVNSAGNQLIDVDTTRGYNLPDGDQFNQVRMFYDYSSGTEDFYRGWVGLKVRWEDWIPDPNADPDFFDDTKPNDNLNKRSNNYDGLNGYQIRAIIVMRTEGEDEVGNSVEGLDVESGGRLETFDYDESDDGLITGYTISLLDPDTGVDLGDVIRRDKDTLFRIEWELSSAPALDNLWGINRIQRTGGTGQQIEEFSSIRTNIEDILKPVSGATLLEVTNPTGNIVRCDCIIDHTKLANGVSYNVSGTLQTPLKERVAYVSFHFRDALSSNVWSVPENVKIKGAQVNTTPLDCTLASAGVPLSTLTYEISTDAGGSYTSYGNNVNAFSTALEAATPTFFSGNVRVRISTSETGYIDSGVILNYTPDNMPSGATIDDVPYDFPENSDTEGQIDQDTIIYFSELIQLNSIIDDLGGEVYAALRIEDPDTDNYTEFEIVYDGTATNTANINAINASILNLTKGVYQSSTTYNAGDVVRDSPVGDFYRANTTTTDAPPSADWDLCNFRYAIHIWAETGINGANIEIRGNYVNYSSTNVLQNPSTSDALLIAVNGSNSDRAYKSDVDARVYNSQTSVASAAWDISDAWNQFDQDQAVTFFCAFYRDTNDNGPICTTSSPQQLFNDRTGGFFLNVANNRLRFALQSGDQAANVGSVFLNVSSAIQLKQGYNIVQLSWDGNGVGNPDGFEMYINGRRSEILVNVNALGSRSIIPNTATIDTANAPRLLFGDEILYQIARNNAVPNRRPITRLARFAIVDYVQGFEEIRENFNLGRPTAASGTFLCDIEAGLTSLQDNGPIGYTFAGTTLIPNWGGYGQTINNTNNYLTDSFFS